MEKVDPIWYGVKLFMPNKFDMENTLEIEQINQAYIRVNAEPNILRDLWEHFSFRPPGYQHMPAFRDGTWDGYIRLFDMYSHQIYAGLFNHVVKFAEQAGIKVLSEDIGYADDISLNQFADFINELKKTLGNKAPRDYQLKSVLKMIRLRRATLLSPTASGKSLITYIISKWYRGKILIIVPTTHLVTQLEKDFIDYGYNKDEIHTITSGSKKNSSAKITISTWQSVYKLPSSYFNNFEVIVGDECHLFTAKCVSSIMTKAHNVKYRFGMTGTLDGKKVHQLMLEGLFGPVINIVTTKQLIDQGHLTPVVIKAVILHYPKKFKSKLSYDKEIQYILSNPARLNFINKLISSLDNNVMALFATREYGNKIYASLCDTITDRNIHYCDGTVPTVERDNIRELMRDAEDDITTASFKTFSTGVDIPNLHHLVLTTPSKGKVRNLQSIGRTLRKHKDKSQASIVDIVDNIITTGDGYCMQHFAERLQIYKSEQFEVRYYNIQLKEILDGTPPNTF